MRRPATMLAICGILLAAEGAVISQSPQAAIHGGPHRELKPHPTHTSNPHTRGAGGGFVIPNCTSVAPPPGDMCWDAKGMEQGLGTTTGPVYTQLHPATDCSNGCWKIVSTIYEGTNERSALNHNIYVRMMWNNGTYINSYPNGPFWTAFWGPTWNEHQGNATKIEAKAPPNWGNFPVWATTPDWVPAICHCPGPYGAYAGSNMAQSDVLYGCGMPVHHHVNWLSIFKWFPSGATTP